MRPSATARPREETGLRPRGNLQAWAAHAAPMSRAAAALALLAMLLLASPPPAEAQAPGIPSLNIPTQQNLVVGSVNMTMWLMRTAESVAYQRDPLNPLASIFNATLSAGSAGQFYAKATAADNGSYEVRVALQAEPAVLVTTPTNATGGCTPAGWRITCRLNATQPTSDSYLSFHSGITSPPGDVSLPVSVEVYTLDQGAPVFQARGDATFTVHLIAPVPAFASSGSADGATLHGWVQAGILGYTGGGCLAGASATHDENVSRGFPAVVCLFALPAGTDTYRVNTNFTAPAWATLTQPGWQSRPFNASSPATDAYTALFMQSRGEAPVGAASLHVAFALEKLVGGNWTAAGQGAFDVPFTVRQGPIIPTAAGRVNWAFQAPVLVATVGALGYLAYQNRSPALQPRSQALRAMSKRPKGGDGGGAAVQAEVAQQREEAAEAAWDKKRLILDAKREDILKSIRIAEERKQRGEITEHVLNGIKERKERQLEQVEQELRELGP
jgi:hypothetical protein